MLIHDINRKYLPLDKAIVYYRLLSVINSWDLTERDVQLLAYTNRRGTISSITAKQEFVRIFSSSIPTINNMISKLKRKKLLVKQNRKIMVNPKMSIDFSQRMVLVLRLENLSKDEY